MAPIPATMGILGDGERCLNYDLYLGGGGESMTTLPPRPPGNESNDPYYVPVDQDIGILRIKKEDGTHCVVAWDGADFRSHRCLVHDVWVFFRISFQPEPRKTE